MPLAGGPAQTVAEGGLWKGGAWLADGTIVVGGTGLGGLGRVSADGGSIEPLTTIGADRGELGHWWPVALPGAEKVLFTVVGSLPADSQIAVLDLTTGRWHTLVDKGWSPRFLPPDRLLFARGNSVVEIPFDVRSGRVTGPPRRALDGIASLPGASAQFDVSPTGTLAYLQGPPTERDAELVRVENGRVTGRVVPEARPFELLTVDSVTGRIAVSIAEEEKRSDLWIVEDGGLRRLTFSGRNFLPLWAPGGKEIYFASDRDGSFDLYRKAADGASPARRILSAPGHIYPQTASPDGRWLVYALTDAETGWDLWRLDPAHPRDTPTPLVVGPDDQLQASLSPDGRWLAYSSNETGRWEVFVEPTDGSGGRWQVTTGGGALPSWSPTGETLFCVTPGAVVARTVLAGQAFRTGPTCVVFDRKDDLRRGLGLLRATDRPGQLVGFRSLDPSPPADAVTDLQVVIPWRGDGAAATPPEAPPPPSPEG